MTLTEKDSSQHSTLEWLDNLPKTELHVHLEGAIPLETLWGLIREQGGDSKAPSFEALKTRFTFTNFAHFIEMWVWKSRFIRTYEHYERMAQAVAVSFVQQNIVYVEAFCSPGDAFRHGLNALEVLRAVRRGLDQVSGVHVRLIVDLIRDLGPDRGMTLLEECAPHAKELDIVGIGIGGSEQRFPPEPWEGVFRRAKEMGFHTTAHAGEAAGPQSVWAAIQKLKVDRIGHGVRAVEDSELVHTLIQTRIPLELCPISNVCTGIYPSLKRHPVRVLFDAGVHLTIHTDDPTMFQTSLVKEFKNRHEDPSFFQGGDTPIAAKRD